MAAPATAHTDSELDVWFEGWTYRYAAALAADQDTSDLTAERVDMIQRHVCQLTRYCRPYAPTRPATAPEPGHVNPGIEQWRALVSAYFPASSVEAALSVMSCESGGNPWAKNRISSAAGLFQFIRDTWNRTAVPLGYGDYDSGAVYDPVANVHAASVLSKGGSTWQQWSCKP